MAKPLKYEKPRLINLSSTEWEIGAGICTGGSSPNAGDPDCTNGTGPTPQGSCKSGTDVP